MQRRFALASALLALALGRAAFSMNTPLLLPTPCTAEEVCYNTSAWRCVPAPQGVAGAPCTLDYQYNATGTCVCSSEGPYATCVNGSYAAPTPGAKQVLVIGDSISMGYFGTLQTNLRCGSLLHACVRVCVRACVSAFSCPASCRA